MKPELGICMEICAEPMLNAITSLVDPEKLFIYAELGIAEGKTFFGVIQHIEHLTPNYYAFGVDVVNGWSLNQVEIDKNSNGFPKERFSITLEGSLEFLKNAKDESIDFLLIDACHARECCMNDFLAAESKIKKGGIVMFHDSGESEIGQDVQPHCAHPIDVRGAVKDLQLLQEERIGWKLLADIQGQSRGCILVQKQ